ncbi:peptidase S8 [bacterium]|nr:peptidase S8 [bacterium]
MKKHLIIILALFSVLGFCARPARYIIKGDPSAVSSFIKGESAFFIKKVDTFSIIIMPETRRAEDLRDLAIEKYGLDLFEKDHLKKINFIPNDTLYADYQWNMERIGFEDYSDISIGSPSVIVAVVDTGIDLDHPDLAANLVTGRNLILADSGGNPYSPTNPDDDHGHGTHCAGTVGAIANNNLGVVGVAPGVSIMPIKVLADDGYGYDSDIAEGVRWAADNGADVLSMSIGGGTGTTILAEAVDYAYGNGCVVIAATGNEGKSSIDYPSLYTNVIAVGASDYSDGRSSYSNYGEGMDIVAPGGDPVDGPADWNNWIASTYNNGDYAWSSGTSMACPHVAGAAALLVSLGFTNPDQVKLLLTSTAVDSGDPGYDLETGHGRLDVFNALNVAVLETDPGVKVAYCFPNPFSGLVNVVYKPEKSGLVSFTVFSEFMDKLYSDEREGTAGTNVIFSWDSVDEVNGVFFLHINGPDGKKTVRGLRIR